MGCDPEFWLFSNGKVVGSERVLKKGSINARNNSKVVVDGVQAEINPEHSTCRQTLSGNIASCFVELVREMDNPELKGKFNVDFSPLVKVEKAELDALSDSAKKLGCAPSMNAYRKIQKGIKVNPLVYRKRSAGGHIHLGSAPTSNAGRAVRNYRMIVPLLDALVGNTCVLMDRDVANKERRKVYGRAGEYRETQFGVEYRTLSNFWLKSYPLMSFVFSMGRFAVNVLANSTKEENYAKEILSTVNRTDVKRAINNNDYELAYSNFKKLEPLILEMAGSYSCFPITKDNINEFHYFLKKDMGYWFKENPIDHWLRRASNVGAQNGWEAFLSNVVRRDMRKPINVIRKLMSRI